MVSISGHMLVTPEMETVSLHWRIEMISISEVLGAGR
jgi:hypothetical protein